MKRYLILLVFTLLIHHFQTAILAQSDFHGEQLVSGGLIFENLHDYGESKPEIQNDGAKIIWGENW